MHDKQTLIDFRLAGKTVEDLPSVHTLWHCRLAWEHRFQGLQKLKPAETLAIVYVLCRVWLHPEILDGNWAWESLASVKLFQSWLRAWVHLASVHYPILSLQYNIIIGKSWRNERKTFTHDWRIYLKNLLVYCYQSVSTCEVPFSSSTGGDTD